jgi:hypothetical protein
MVPWEELKRLEATCHVDLSSKLERSNGLVWSLVIKPRDRDGPMIHVEHPEISETVKVGVQKAKESGLFPQAP